MGIVYCATNKVNGKIYIGQTTKTLERRMTQHKSSMNCGSQYYFHKALLKYGWDDFNFVVLENVKNSELNESEIMWINASNSNNPDIGYNLNEGGMGQKGNHKKYQKKYRKWTEKSRIRASESQLGEKNHNYGRHFSEEHREKIRVSNLGKNLGKVHTEEAKIRIGIRSKGNKNPNASAIMNMDTKEIFLTIREAVDKYGLQSSNITKCCLGQRNICGGFHWAYRNEEQV